MYNESLVVEGVGSLVFAINPLFRGKVGGGMIKPGNA